MDDEVDEHHRSRDKISLDPDADSDDDDAFDASWSGDARVAVAFANQKLEEEDLSLIHI